MKAFLVLAGLLLAAIHGFNFIQPTPFIPMPVSFLIGLVGLGMFLAGLFYEAINAPAAPRKTIANNYSPPRLVSETNRARARFLRATVELHVPTNPLGGIATGNYGVVNVPGYSNTQTSESEVDSWNARLSQDGWQLVSTSHPFMTGWSITKWEYQVAVEPDPQQFY